MVDEQPRGGGNVALYWDLENVHVSLGHLEAASGATARGLVDMDAVVESAPARASAVGGCSGSRLFTRSVVS